MIVRTETPADAAAIHRLNELAFGQPAEAELVDVLRVAARPFLSLVAEEGGEIAGHICFTPVTMEDSLAACAALAPMAVLPGHQREGIGSRLVEAGLEECRRDGFGLVVVLGHPEYYPRFSFRPASSFGLRCEYDVPDPAFMALELTPGAADGVQGLARYHAAFAAL
ncbi:MAG TPA: N-acetyltransferase [Thermoanaerobaculia bacterium]|jgi:putative acetyltransferase